MSISTMTRLRIERPLICGSISYGAEGGFFDITSDQPHLKGAIYKWVKQPRT
jgi:hypothetical protein